MDSPVGRLTLVATNDGLAAILWEGDRPSRVPLNIEEEDREHPVLVEVERQLQEYFAGRRRQFEIPIDVDGTPFQRKVWKALRTIPFGETRSYGQIASQIGHASASRAVGAANGRNPLSIVAPCHRVIGSTGQLTGFAGGLDVKAKLLAFEGGAGVAEAPASDRPRRRGVRPHRARRVEAKESVRRRMLGAVDHEDVDRSPARVQRETKLLG
jgi:methylated-DNA-[protein]-cysteine S-methyltransferase